MAPKVLKQQLFGTAEALVAFVGTGTKDVVAICYHPNSGFYLFYNE